MTADQDDQIQDRRRQLHAAMPEQAGNTHYVIDDMRMIHENDFNRRSNTLARFGFRCDDEDDNPHEEFFVDNHQNSITFYDVEGIAILSGPDESHCILLLNRFESKGLMD